MDKREPDIIRHFDCGAVSLFGWTDMHNQYHRSGAPANVAYWVNGNSREEEWRCSGTLHRRDGPAHTGYYEDGSLHWESWYWFGERHRIDGPCTIVYGRDGTIKRLDWYIRHCEYENVNDWIRENPGLPKDKAVELKLIYG